MPENPEQKKHLDSMNAEQAIGIIRVLIEKCFGEE
jgi:hypothetical protein